MASNSFGNIFKLTTFGESHGIGIGGIIDGCPSGLKIDIDLIQKDLDRRRPGQSSITTPRDEEDKVEILSGLFEGTTTGTPIAFIVKNKNVKSHDYNHIKDTYRPSHADYTYTEKYGVRDYRGGGRSSARETIARVVAGAIAKQILCIHNIDVYAYVSQVGNIKTNKAYYELKKEDIEKNIIRCPDLTVAKKMIARIEEVRDEGDTIGGIITCVIKGLKPGVGEPIYIKLDSELAKAMLTINATKGFDYGKGFDGVELKGSEQNDSYIINDSNNVTTKTNNSGGIQGGISNGEDVYCRVLFKPIATIMKTQQTISSDKKQVSIDGKGRHDPCVLPRAVPIVEAMAAIVTVDLLLLGKASKLQ